MGCCPHEILSSTVSDILLLNDNFFANGVACHNIKKYLYFCVQNEENNSVLTNVHDVFSENNKLLLNDEGLDVFVCM